jgi:hypothetical protein
MERKKISEVGSKDWIMNNLMKRKKVLIKLMKLIFHHLKMEMMMMNHNRKRVIILIMKDRIVKMRYKVKVRTSSKEIHMTTTMKMNYQRMSNGSKSKNRT